MWIRGVGVGISAEELFLVEDEAQGHVTYDKPKNDCWDWLRIIRADSLQSIGMKLNYRKYCKIWSPHKAHAFITTSYS